MINKLDKRQIDQVRYAILNNFQPRLYNKEYLNLKVYPCWSLLISTENKIFTIASCKEKRFSFKYTTKQSLIEYMETNQFILNLEKILITR